VNEFFENEVLTNPNHKFDNLSNKIQTQIDDLFNETKARVKEEFDRFCKEKEILGEVKLIEKRTIELLRNNETRKQRMLNIFQKKISDHVEVKSIKAGNIILNEMGTQLLQKRDKYSDEEAEDEF